MDTKTKTESKSRRIFLKTAGSTALFAALGIGFYGCGDSTSADYGSEENNGGQPDTPPPPEGTISGFTEVRSSNEGVTVDGNRIELDLTEETLSSLNNEGQALWLRDELVLTVNVDGTTIRSFTAICTHSACSDNWVLGGNLFECACHGSRFNSTGGVVRGPAQSELPEFSTSRDEDDENILIITKS